MTSKRLRLLLDTNIWIGYFLKSSGSFADIAALIEAGAAEEADILFAPTTIKDVFYLLPRAFRREEEREGAAPASSYAPAAWGCIEWMLEMFTASPLGAFECQLAAKFRGQFGDYEDDLLLASGESAEVDYIVTLDEPLLSHYPDACVTPGRALELTRAWPRA